MPCPSCALALTPARRLGIAVESCSGCGGVWLSQEDLDKVIHRALALSHSRRHRPGRLSGQAEGGYWFGKYPEGFKPL